jgi:hypothetical protein
MINKRREVLVFIAGIRKFLEIEELINCINQILNKNLVDWLAPIGPRLVNYLIISLRLRYIYLSLISSQKELLYIELVKAN